MIKPSIPENENARLQALYKLNILHSESEERFDRLTRLAANYFNVKICLVSFIDSNKLWFKSNYGLKTGETERAISFCAHTILQNDILIVADARQDKRFVDSPLVTDEPHIVFYAGAPLSTIDGYKIGTLCLKDDKPRVLNLQEINALRDFADMIEQEINDIYFIKLQQERKQASIRMQHILEIFPDIVFIFQKDLRYVASNEHKDLYLPQQEFIGRTVHEVLPQNIATLFEQSLKQAFESTDLISFNYQLKIDSKPNYFEARAKKVTEEEVVVIVRNTTEEHAKNVDLERLSMVAQQTTNGVIITDVHKKVLWVNDAFTYISGYTIKEMLGKNPGEILQGPDTDLVTIQRMHEGLKQNKNFTVDILNYHKKGHSYWTRIVCNPWLDRMGALKGFIAIQSDISQEVHNLEQIQQNQNLLDSVIEANSIGTWSLNLQTGILIINEQWARLLGYSLYELEPVSLDTWKTLTHPEDLYKCLKLLDEYNKGLIDYYEAPIRMKHKEGRWVWIRTRGNITSRTEAGTPEKMLGTHIDITAQMLAEDQLQEQYDYMQLIFDNMVDGIIISDSENIIQSFNPSSKTIFNYSPQEILNQKINLLIPTFNKLKSDGKLQYTEGKRKNGSIFPIEVGIVKSQYKQEAIFVSILRDVTEKKNVEESIHKLAYFDGLTGLPNRQLMFDRLQQAISKTGRHKKYIALLFIDFDNFKRINDSFGHNVGDQLLKQISIRLKNLVRGSDTVSRLAGDEFIVILEDLDSDLDLVLKCVESKAEKIKLHLNKPYELEKITYISSCSIGIALSNQPTESASDLLKQADLAMYDAKMAGKHAIKFFSDEMQETVNIRSQLEQDLRKALTNDEFEIYYQTQVNATGKSLGAECLLRWRHPLQGYVSPMKFIPIAEESGLIVPIGLWTLNQACMCLARWADNPLTSKLALAVNISVIELKQEDWVENVLRTINVTGANPANLKLEITESVMAIDIEMVKLKLTKLRDYSVCISLDDFGTGYSSLSYLKSLPINELKIDKSFIKNILSDPSEKAIAGTIISLANMMELHVIAEGIETKEQFLMLKEMGCQAFQGYYFGKPESIKLFEHHCILNASV